MSEHRGQPAKPPIVYADSGVPEVMVPYHALPPVAPDPVHVQQGRVDLLPTMAIGIALIALIIAIVALTLSGCGPR